MERRQSPRVNVDRDVALAVGGERSVPVAQWVDIGARGALISLAEPFGFAADERVVLTLGAHDDPERHHLLGRVRRVERGTDFRTYVGIEFDEPIEVADLHLDHTGEQTEGHKTPT